MSKIKTSGWLLTEYLIIGTIYSISDTVYTVNAVLGFQLLQLGFPKSSSLIVNLSQGF